MAPSYQIKKIPQAFKRRTKFFYNNVIILISNKC